MRDVELNRTDWLPDNNLCYQANSTSRIRAIAVSWHPCQLSPPKILS